MHFFSQTLLHKLHVLSSLFITRLLTAALKGKLWTRASYCHGEPKNKINIYVYISVILWVIVFFSLYFLWKSEFEDMQCAASHQQERWNITSVLLFFSNFFLLFPGLNFTCWSVEHPELQATGRSCWMSHTAHLTSTSSYI